MAVTWFQFPGGPAYLTAKQVKQTPGDPRIHSSHSLKQVSRVVLVVCVWRGGVVVVRFAGLDKLPRSSDDSQIDSTAGMSAAPHNHQPTVRSDRKTSYSVEPLSSHIVTKVQEVRGKEADNCRR